jgi:SAM-dependent methyltransferase
MDSQMKGRESGMPDEDYWATFFDAEKGVARLLGEDDASGDIVEFGCGYGTFTFPAARYATGALTTFDIEPEMVDRVRQKASEAGLANIRAEVRDFVADGTGLPDGSQSHAMIYNILHLENPLALLAEARRVLRDGGKLSVMHWRSDIPTPRGPSLEIRPTPEQCRGWIEEAGFANVRRIDLEDCCRYHFALVASR